MRKIILFLSCYLLLVTNFQNLASSVKFQILAISPTPTLQTPSITPTGIDEIQKIRQAIQEKVKEKLDQISNPGSQQSPTDNKKAIIGTFIQTSANQITIDYRNTTTSINIGSSTLFIDQNRNKTTLSKLKIGQDVLVMGFLNNQNVIDAKRIVFSDLKAINNSSQTLVGKIVDISKSSPIFVLIPSSNKNTQFQLKNDAKTLIVDQNDKVLDQKSLTAGQKVIAVVKPDPKSTKTYIVLKIINFGPFPEPTAKP